MLRPKKVHMESDQLPLDGTSARLQGQIVLAVGSAPISWFVLSQQTPPFQALLPRSLSSATYGGSAATAEVQNRSFTATGPQTSEREGAYIPVHLSRSYRMASSSSLDSMSTRRRRHTPVLGPHARAEMTRSLGWRLQLKRWALNAYRTLQHAARSSSRRRGG